MQLINRRLKRVDIYSPNEIKSDYIGKKNEPLLLGFVYADVQPEPDSLERNRSGVSVYKSAKLYMRADAGVKVGDYAAVFSDSPDTRITEIKHRPDFMIAKAERIC